MSIIDMFRPKWKRSNSSVRYHAVEKLTNQRVLAKIAQVDSNEHVRLAAADRLTNTPLAQSVFCDIAKGGVFCEEAAQKLTDQMLLADVAKNAKCDAARMITAEKLTDQALAQNVFGDLAKHSYYSKNAIDKLTDQTLLADVARSGAQSRVRMIAAVRLTDKALAQSVFCDLAKYFPCIDSTDMEAVEKLTDQALLANVSVNAKIPKVRHAAVEKLTDQRLLADIAKIAEDSSLRRMAFDKVSDQTRLADVAKADIDGRREGMAAVKKLTEQMLLIAVAKDASYWSIRLEAAKKLASQALAQNIFFEIAKEAYHGEAAVPGLADQVLLADVALNSKSMKARTAAAKKLTDQALAQRVFAHVASAEAIEELTDQTLLADLVKNGRHVDTRMAAAGKLTDRALAQSVFADLAKNASFETQRLAACRT